MTRQMCKLIRGIEVNMQTSNVSSQSCIQRTYTEYIVKCVERVLSYNLQHTVDPAQSLREPLLSVCARVCGTRDSWRILSLEVRSVE